MRACFSFPISEWIWWVHAEVINFGSFYHPFSGWLQKFRNTDIVSLASTRGILELPSAVFSVCQNCYQMLVFCWHVFDRCTNFKFINWYPDMTIWILVQCTVLSYRQAFLESTEISASEELNALEVAPAQFMVLQILGEKGEVQIMPFRKLSRKCYFLLQFCTCYWSETYI